MAVKTAYAREEYAEGEALPEEMMEEAPESIEEGELLTILKNLRENSVGFDNDRTLETERQRALDYYKGDHAGQMAQDMPVQENRSKVVSTDVANQIETALPDLIEVFTNGDDAITFKPRSLDDEEAAKQETDYVRHIIFQQNPGWMLLYNAFKDALLSKVGVFHYYWDGEKQYDEEETLATEAQLFELQAQGVEIIETEDTGRADETGDPIYRATVRSLCSEGHVCIDVIPPEDFTTAAETVELEHTHYAAWKSRPLVQELLAKGYDADKVRSLWDDDDSGDERQARDTLYETDNGQTESGSDDLRQVEIIEHYVRLDLEGDGKPQIWRIVTGNDESVILEKEKRSRIEFAAITPYPMTHRFYGQSLADKAIPVQQWMTSLIRGMNDSLYYANNQRPEVSQQEIIPGVTLEQLVDNQPGAPIVTKTGNGLKPFVAGRPAFDILAAIEYVKTDLESRTGMVRNAQGLNPDTLHDTKGGAEILIGAAQKRVRLMARLFAEQGLKDLFMGVHDLARSNATMADTVRLRGKWVEIEPSSWRRRKDVEIDIGVGSGGREQDLLKYREFRAAMNEVAASEYGPALIKPENVYSFADAYADKLGIKGVDRFISDPSQQPPEQEGPSEAELEMQGEAQKAQMKQEADMAALQSKHSLAIEEMKLEQERNRERMVMEMQLARERADQERELAIYKANLEANVAVATNQNAEPNGGYRPGGRLDQ